MLLRLAEARYCLARRVLVVGILNRTEVSFYDGGRYVDLDAFLNRAGHLVSEGADIPEVGCRLGGVGVRE